MAISWHSMINWSQKMFTFYSRLDCSVIIMYHHKLYLLLVILVVSCHAAFEETSRFLTAMSANNSWRKRSKYARSLPSQTRFVPTLEWGQLEQDSGWGLRHPSGSLIRLFSFWAARISFFVNTWLLGPRWSNVRAWEWSNQYSASSFLISSLLSASTHITASPTGQSVSQRARMIE